MPVLIGELEKITGSPSSVTQVIVRAHTTRITGSALTTDELVPIPVDRQGRFEVPLRPGKAVLVLVHGGRVGEGERFPMLVEEGLGTITSAIKLASDRFDDYEINELEQAAADMLAHIDKAAVSATRAEVAHEGAQKEKVAAEEARQGAETIEQGIPDKVNQEITTQLPGELDERVPPVVAEAIAEDRAVADAAAAAVVDAVDAAMPSKADTTYVDEQDQALGQRMNREKWNRPLLDAASNLDDLGEGSHGVPNTSVGRALGLPDEWWGDVDERWMNPSGTIRVQMWIYWKGGTLNLWARQHYEGTWTDFQRIFPITIPDAPAGDSWHRGVVGADVASLSELEDGVWSVASPTVADRLGIIGSQTGTLKLATIVNGRTALFQSGAKPSRLSITSYTGGTWDEWSEVGGTPTPVEPAPEPEPDVWFKTAPMAVTTGSAITYRSPTDATYRVLTQSPAPAARWRLHVETRHSMHDTLISEATMTSITVGHRSGEHDLTDTTALLGEPAHIPEDGTWTSEWVRHDLTEETLIEYTYTAPGEVLRMAAPAWEKQTDGSWVQKNTAPLFLWVEVETYAETPVVAMIGDSTGVGSGSISAVWDSPLHISAREWGFLPVLYGNTGDGMIRNTSMSARNFSKWADRGFAQPDSVIIQAGSNDVHATGRTFTQMQDRLRSCITLAKQLAPVVYGSTIKPRRNPDPAQDAVRIQYNQWVQDNHESLGLHGVIDYATAVAPSGVVADEVSADDAHLNSLGQNRMASALDFPVSGPEVVTTRTVEKMVGGQTQYTGHGFPEGRVDAPLGATYIDEDATGGAIRWAKTTPTGTTGWRVEVGDTGWREIPLMTGTGRALIRRTEKGVTLRLINVALSGNFPVHVIQLPFGFRWSYRKSFTALNSLEGKPSTWSMYSADKVSWFRNLDGTTDRPTDPQSGAVTFDTSDTWPATRPGTPAAV